MLDGKLQDFRLLQLGGSLFFKGGWHQAAQLGQRTVDSVSAALLDDAASPLSRHVVARASFNGRQTPLEKSEKLPISTNKYESACESQSESKQMSERGRSLRASMIK